MTDSAPHSEPAKSPVLAALQKDILNRAGLLRQHAPKSGGLPRREGETQLVAQQPVKSDTITRGIVNVELSGDPDKVFSDGGVQLQDPQDKVILSLINEGRGALSVSVERGRITVTAYPDRGVDLKALGFPERPGFPPTYVFDVGNTMLTDQEIAPLRNLDSLLGGMIGPDALFQARRSETDGVAPPSQWPIDSSATYISKEVRHLAAPGERERKPNEKRIFSLPEHVTPKEREWMATFFRDMNPQNALEWFTHTADTLTRRQLQLARHAITERTRVDKEVLMESFRKGNQPEQSRTLFAAFMTDTYAQNVLSHEERDRNFKLNPTVERAHELTTSMENLLEVRQVVQELAEGKQENALMNYVLRQQEAERQLMRSNLEAANESSTSLPEALFQQAKFTKENRQADAMWARVYKLFF